MFSKFLKLVKLFLLSFDVDHYCGYVVSYTLSLIHIQIGNYIFIKFELSYYCGYVPIYRLLLYSTSKIEWNLSFFILFLYVYDIISLIVRFGLGLLL